MAVKAGKIVLTVVIVIIVLILVMLFVSGFFNKVETEKIEKGPYFIVAIEHIGPYYKIAEKINDVSKYLEEKGIEPLAGCGIYYDDPKEVQQEKLRSKPGFIVEEKLEVKPPYLLEIVEKREVLLASIKAHPAVAPLKIYPAVDKWLEQNGYESDGPVLEIYRKNGIVEAEIPIKKK